MPCARGPEKSPHSRSCVARHCVLVCTRPWRSVSLSLFDLVISSCQCVPLIPPHFAVCPSFLILPSSLCRSPSSLIPPSSSRRRIYQSPLHHGLYCTLRPLSSPTIPINYMSQHRLPVSSRPPPPHQEPPLTRHPQGPLCSERLHSNEKSRFHSKHPHNNLSRRR